mmetsp:Transcript_23322/g.40132  ORF Transcript_23322/g.40132 Transcript_23322/m.40132 type:complete len:156 (+) Transcript_23322:57-524(+)
MFRVLHMAKRGQALQLSMLQLSRGGPDETKQTIRANGRPAWTTCEIRGVNCWMGEEKKTKKQIGTFGLGRTAERSLPWHSLSRGGGGFRHLDCLRLDADGANFVTDVCESLMAAVAVGEILRKPASANPLGFTWGKIYLLDGAFVVLVQLVRLFE